MGLSLRRLISVLLVCTCLNVQFAYSQTETEPDAVSPPKTYTSRNFIVHTDLSEEKAKELLERLETMLGLISTYWGRRNAKTIECFVVEDITNWPRGAMPPEGLAKVREGAGVTLTQTITIGNRFDANAKVYAVADRGTPQHEAVHAYCAQMFGTTGPVWYSEGMAEMGNYWRKGDSSVEIHPGVLKYLQTTEPKSLNEIVNAQELTGDSWENYAWRWALCHLLANNTNYQARFRPLGLDLLQQKATTFESVYGSMANEIVFEYILFLQNIEQGYRVDLCSWDWRAKPRKLRGKRPLKSTIEAGEGWQPSRAFVEEGLEYEYTTEGTWQVVKDGTDLDADGDKEGKGKLVGVVFDDYQLSDPIELGAYGTFKAPAEGQLFLRCQDAWGAIADNKGKMGFQIREKQPEGEDPLPDPRKK